MKAGTPAESDGDAGAVRTRQYRDKDELTSADLDVVWRAVDRRKRREERKIAAGQAAEFRRQGAAAVKRFNEAVLQGRLMQPNRSTRDFKHITASSILNVTEMLEGHISQLSPAVRDAIRSGWAAASARVKIDVPVDFDDERIRDVLQRLNEQMNGVVQVTVDKINTLIQRGIREDWTTQQMAEAINKQFKQYSIVRSKIIAQTSGTAAFEAAQSSAYKRGGVEKKQWLTQRDGAVRAAHIVADGDTVGIDDTFTVDGESLEYPGDPSGSAGNVINCRCSMLPVIEDEPTE